MRHRKTRDILLPILLFLLINCIPVEGLAEVEANLLSTLNLDKNPTDVSTTMDGKWVYILTPGEVQIYSPATKTLLGRFPVDKAINRISASSRGDQLYLINEKTKTLSIISVAFIQKINMTDAPFKGPTAAPVVIAVFSDYQ